MPAIVPQGTVPFLFPVCLGPQLSCRHKFVYAAAYTHPPGPKCELGFHMKVEMVTSLAMCSKEKGLSHVD